MATINTMVFDVTGTELSLRERTSESTSGSLNADRCCFYFDSAWEDCGGKIAFFGADRDRLVPVALTQALDGDNLPYCYCTVPRSVLAQCGGNLYIGVQGTDNNNTPALDDDSTLRSKLYRVNVADSGEVRLYITAEETENFLASVGARLAAFEGKAIASAAINSRHELVLTMENGTVINLGNVRGEMGPEGDGLKSAEVIDGVLWIQKTYGSNFSAGYVKGDKGDKGDTGAQGAKGDKGDTGEQGAKGDKGDTGAQGAKGDKGDKGDTGAAGAAGKSAYEIALENGYSGTEAQWLASLVGATGAKGDKGDKGDTGAQGAKGDKGDTGEQGAKGDKGDTGAAGSDAKQLNNLRLVTDGGMEGNVTLLFNDQTALVTTLNLKPALPTGAGGSDERYFLQDLATYLYNALQGKQNQTVITGADGNDYTVRFRMDNGAPSVICEQV